MGAKGQSPHGWEKYLSILKDFGDEPPYFVVNANSNTNSHLGSPIGMSKEVNSSNYSNSFISSFAMTMPIKTIGTTSIEEQLAEMTHVITKLTKTIEEERSTNSILHEQALF